MSIVFTRVGIPVSGRLDDAAKFMRDRAAAISKAYGVDVGVNARFGGPVGQMALVSYHDTLGELEDIRRKVIEDTIGGKLPMPEGGLFRRSEDAVWMKL
jgi:hypothetical protein